MKGILFFAYLCGVLPALSADPAIKEIRRKAVGEKIETLTTLDSRTYKGVTVVSVDDVGIAIRSEEGPSRIAFERLDATMRKRFGYDPGAAERQKKAEAAEQLKHDREMEQTPAVPVPTQKGVPEPAAADPEPTEADGVEEGADQPLPALEAVPDTKEVAALRAYIARLEAGIKTAGLEASQARADSMKYMARSFKSVTYRGKDGFSRTEQVTDKGKVNRAKSLEKKARRIEENIVIARGLIQKTQTKIDSLKSIPAEKAE